MLGEKLRGFDRDFMRALATASTSGKMVLGEILRGDQPIRPSAGQRIAVRQQQNIRPLNIYTDDDDVRPPGAADLFGQRRAGAGNGA